MPWFRTPTSTPKIALSPERVRHVIADVVHRCHFFTRGKTNLTWQQPGTETVPWEIYAGRLLDAPMTRHQRTFESRNIHLITPEGRSAEPLLSVKLDAAAGEIHVVRAILCHAWESYTEGNVVLSRETRRWVRELVGTVRLERFGTVEELRDELICLLFQAVVGTSRLPLTSSEAPLPAFSFGELFYGYRPPGYLSLSYQLTTAKPEVIPDLNDLERAKLLEVLLHATPSTELSRLSDQFDKPLDVLRTLFNEVSLSPYTGLVDKALAWLNVLQQQQRVTAEDVADFLTRLLRLLGRHLTAFDLVNFLHRRGNYPGATLVGCFLE